MAIKPKKSISGKEPLILFGLLLVGILLIINLVVMLSPPMVDEEHPQQVKAPNTELLIRMTQLEAVVNTFQNTLSAQDREMLRLFQLINGIEAQLVFVPKSSSPVLPPGVHVLDQQQPMDNFSQGR